MTEQSQAPQSWGRWPQHHTSPEYGMMDNSGFMPYDSRDGSNMQLPGPLMTPHYVVGPPYTTGPMTNMTPAHCSPQNAFVYSYETAHAPMVVPFRQPPHPERPILPLPSPDHGMDRPNSYQSDERHGHDDRGRSASVRSDSQTSTPKTPHPLNTKDIKLVRPVKAAPVEFATPIDLLMKVIQKRNDIEEAMKELGSEQQGINSEPQSPQDESVRDGDPNSKEARYGCPIKGCGKRFRQNTHLETHIRAHTGEKPFACSWPRCDRSFSQPGNLKTHMRRHTGERPFPCDECGKRFAQRGNLQAHKITHTRVKPFPCTLDECNKEFSQRGNLKHHQCKYHQQKLLELAEWFALLTDVKSLSPEERNLYTWFKTMYKNSNKGIKGRGKDRRVSNRSKTKAIPSHFPVKRMPGAASLAAYSTKRTNLPEQRAIGYNQFQPSTGDNYDPDADHSSNASSPRFGMPNSAFSERMFHQSNQGMLYDPRRMV